MSTESRKGKSANSDFEIDELFSRMGAAVRKFPKAMCFELADEGFGSPFQILIACVISIRTFEEVSLPAARRLFEVASTPETIAALNPAKIDQLIHTATFHTPKSKTI